MVQDGFAWRYPQYDMPGESCAALGVAPRKAAGAEVRSLIFLASALVPVHAEHMVSDPFLESCSLANEQESQRAYYLPSLVDIELLKRQIRAEKVAKEGGPPHVNADGQPRIHRASHYGQRRKHPSSVG
jgi:hypothetical protein